MTLFGTTGRTITCWAIRPRSLTSSTGATTRLAAAFHGEMLDMMVDDLFLKPGALKVLGKPIDLSKVTIDKFFVSGLTDHITPWKGGYAAARGFGGTNEFILSGGGHIQSLVNPPGNP